METLQQKEKRLDKEKGLTDFQQLEKIIMLREWRRQLAKINSALIRMSERSPNDSDWEAIEKIQEIILKQE